MTMKRLRAAVLVAVFGAAGLVMTTEAQESTGPGRFNELVTSAQPGAATPACAACRNSCVDRRESCKQQACSAAGGRNAAGSCEDVKNASLYSTRLQSCSVQENACWDACERGACKR